MPKRDPVDQTLVEFILKTIKSRSTNQLLEYNSRMNMTLREMTKSGLTADQLNALPIHFILDSVNKGEISKEELIDAGLNEEAIMVVEGGRTEPETETETETPLPPPPLQRKRPPIGDPIRDEDISIKHGGLSQESLLSEIRSGDALIEDIQTGINRKLISKEDLFESGCKAEFIERLLSYSSVPIKFPSIKELEPLRKNATDIYLLGRRGSGKSTMLASFFNYAKSMGVIVNTQDSSFGNKYRNQLQLGMIEGHLPSSTPKQFINHIPINLKFENNIYHQPLNFLDMAGELIDDVYEEGISGFQTYKDFLENQNDKILIFVINYFENKTKIAEQEQHLDELFSIIKKFNITRKTIGVYLLLTKADLFPDSNKQKFCDDFINKHYIGLLNTIKTDRKDHKYVIRSFPFSIGPTKFSYILEDCDPNTNTNLITYPKILMQQFEEDCPVSRRGL